MKRNCIQCGKEFELTDSEIKFYKSKNLQLPKRCKECREKNKAGNGAKRNEPAAENTNYPGQSGNNSAKGKGKLAAVIAFLIIVAAVIFGIFGDDFSKGGSDTPLSPSTSNTEYSETNTTAYRFRNAGLLNQHYKKHGIDMGFDSAEAYEAAASAVITGGNAEYKTEAEDGDGVYYIKSTQEFVVLSTDGYIRTYYYADYDYFLRQ